jgi:hypothetical protein
MALPASAVVSSSLITGWGTGLHSLPADARAAADGYYVLPVACPASDHERLRRATRECALAVAAVELAVQSSPLTPSDLAGSRTALIYASASAYAAANWAFLTGGREQTVYFPYTAASAVPGEVTIQFGITGPYLSLLSGANAGIEALWQAAVLLTNNQCDRAVVLGVETFTECEDLFATGRWLLSAPLVETAACLILERHAVLARIGYSTGCDSDGLALLDTVLAGQTPAAVYCCLPTARDGRDLAQRLQASWPHASVTVVSERAGTCLACAPLIALQLSAGGERAGNVVLISRWWDAWAVLYWPAAVCAARSDSERKDV